MVFSVYLAVCFFGGFSCFGKLSESMRTWVYRVAKRAWFEKSFMISCDFRAATTEKTCGDKFSYVSF